MSAPVTTPQWFNKSFLEIALRNYKHDETIEVLNFEVKSGFGGHFASTMFQSKVEFKSQKFPKAEPETLNVVIKAMPIDEADKMSVVSNGPLFETETKMYSRVLPRIHQLFESSGLKVEIEPDLIYATAKPFPLIVLKNLTQNGFSAPFKAIKLDDSKHVTTKLAQFHAASFFLAETRKEDFSDFNFCIYQNEVVIQEFLIDALVIFKEVLETWEGYDEYLARVDSLMKNIFKIGKAAFATNNSGDGYNVLNHGDFHLKNLLVKNTQNRLEGVRFIDFQLSAYSSPAVDLYYLFGTVERDEDGNSPSDEIVMFYHQEFCKALKAFGFMKAPPTLLDLNIELFKHGAFGVVFTLCFLPFMYIDWDKISIENMMRATDESREFKKNLYNHPTVRKLLQREMKSWVYKGWF